MPVNPGPTALHGGPKGFDKVNWKVTEVKDGPTASVGGSRPPVRPRPGGVPDHVRKRRTRLVLAIVLLLAITIGAVGWWLGSGRWTAVPELVGQKKDTAIGLLQEAGLDPDCCE